MKMYRKCLNARKFTVNLHAASDNITPFLGHLLLYQWGRVNNKGDGNKENETK